jgi:thiamine biosynthesis protein ThiS
VRSDSWVDGRPSVGPVFRAHHGNVRDAANRVKPAFGRFDYAISWTRFARQGALTCPESTRYAGQVGILQVTITLNGEPFELDAPLSVTDLLTQLEIDPRRVAVEHNLTILKRHTFTTVVIGEGDRLEIVNAVGGG